MCATKRSNNTILQNTKQSSGAEQPNQSILGEILYTLISSHGKIYDFLTDKMTKEEYKEFERKALEIYANN